MYRTRIKIIYLINIYILYIQVYTILCVCVCVHTYIHKLKYNIFKMKILPVRATKAKSEVEAELHSFLTLALDGRG